MGVRPVSLDIRAARQLEVSEEMGQHGKASVRFGKVGEVLASPSVIVLGVYQLGGALALVRDIVFYDPQNFVER